MLSQILNFERKKSYWIIGLVLFCGLVLSCSKGEDAVSKTIKESEHLIQAKEAFLQGDWDKVIQYGEEGIKKEPDDAILSQLLLAAYVLKGDDFYKKAIEFTIKKEVLLEKNEKKFLNWARNLVKNNSQNSYSHYCLSKSMGKKKKAIGPLKKAIEINSQFSEAYSRLGMIFEEKKAWDKAEFYLKKALENSQNSKAINLWRLSFMYLSSKKYELAESYALKAIEKKTDFEMAYLTLGAIYFRMNELGKAINSWKEFVRLDPEEKIGKGIKEQILLLEKMLKNKEILLKSVSMDEEKISILKEALLQGDWNKLIEFGEKEIKENPHNLLLCHLLHSAYEFKGDPFLEKVQDFLAEIEPLFKNKKNMNKVFTWAEELTKKYPQNCYAHFHLGKSSLGMGKSGKAIESFKKAIEINPTFSEAYFRLGAIYEQVNSLNKAEYYLKKALENPQNSEAKYSISLADIYESLKEYNLAMDYALRAIEKKPDYTGAYVFIGTLYTKKGNYNLEMAKNYWEKAVQLDPNGENGKLAQEWILSLPKK
ncbi:tetratricopeptide repeat protein [bacterium]|nr:tetratricopeptide repeat protein [bacterium]